MQSEIINVLKKSSLSKEQIIEKLQVSSHRVTRHLGKLVKCKVVSRNSDRYSLNEENLTEYPISYTRNDDFEKFKKHFIPFGLKAQTNEQDSTQLQSIEKQFIQS